ncbi:MAG: phage tail protein I [Methylobacterium sp.]|uniref:phage tail protein I n=1 Tax=Methylobacterium sp. TaxID=409 RepID=UPI0027288EA1|nr:phage tail protein I [Methylobacterium sp.]MDO9428445.1 phage tail protein I [Methylobacterium sp.]
MSEPFLGSRLLPSGATPLEKAWADTQGARAGTVDPDIVRTITDPWRCPAALLPWLAYSFSVDVWDPDWPEATKRAVIAASPEVHRIKGTRRAIRVALEALGLGAQITEWWETTPPGRRGTFTVATHADGSGPPLDLALIRSAQLAVRRAKPKSRVLTFTVALASQTPILIAGTTRGLRNVTVLPRLDPRPSLVAPLHVASPFDITIRRLTLPPRIAGAVAASGPVAIAGAFGAGVCTSVVYPRT